MSMEPVKNLSYAPAPKNQEILAWFKERKYPVIAKWSNSHNCWVGVLDEADYILGDVNILCWMTISLTKEELEKVYV